MDAKSFIVHVKDIYQYNANNVEKRFDTSNYELETLLPKGISKKVIGLMNDELGRKIKKEIIGLRAETYSYLTDNNDENKKAKGTKNV